MSAMPSILSILARLIIGGSNEFRIVSNFQFESLPFRALHWKLFSESSPKSLSESYGYYWVPFIFHASVVPFLFLTMLSSFLITPLIRTQCMWCHAEVMPNEVWLNTWYRMLTLEAKASKNGNPTEGLKASSNKKPSSSWTKNSDWTWKFITLLQVDTKCWSSFLYIYLHHAN